MDGPEGYWPFLRKLERHDSTVLYSNYNGKVYVQSKEKQTKKGKKIFHPFFFIVDIDFWLTIRLIKKIKIIIYFVMIYFIIK
jgi:hypothetical protein